MADYADPAPSGRGRPVSAVSWSPDGGTSIAVAYCSPEFLGDGSSGGSVVVSSYRYVTAVPLGARHHSGYVYSVEDTTKHSCELRSTSCLTSISHNPKRWV